ncbi:hypothetical protein GCM10020227_58920 [Streptomyces flavovirens]
MHAPWALALSARLGERYGMDAQVMHADDGIVLRLPDADMMGLDLLDFDPVGTDPGDPATGAGAGTPAPVFPGGGFDSDQPPVGATDVVFDKGEISQVVTDQVGSSALFASRFRECAARALLLPRRSPGKRTPLWQQRQRASQLLQVASEFGSFPIVLEAVRECLQDVFDVPGLTELMGDLEARRIRLVEVTTQEPSPFARFPPLRLCRAVPLRGRLPPGRAACRRALARLPPPGRTARAGGAARAAGRRRPRRAGARAAMADRRQEDQGRRGRRRSAARPRSAHRRGARRARRRAAVGTGVGDDPPGHRGPHRRSTPLGGDRGTRAGCATP